MPLVPSFDEPALWRISVAFLCGLAIGIERQWSGHAHGREARLGGVRTFAMLGLVSGLSGWLWTTGLEGIALVLLGGMSALVVVAYIAASRHDIDGTTDVAAFVVLAAGVLAGVGYNTLASGIVAVTLLLLVEKKQLHGMVSKIDRQEMQAAARFAVMAAIVLPLLPPGPYGPWDAIRPRQLWILVLFFSGLSFAGYLARRLVGETHGYAVTGALGGLVSSTSVTLTFSRLSVSNAGAGRALAAGVLGANVVLFPRVLIATAALAPPLAVALWPAFVAPVVAGVLLFALGTRGTPHAGSGIPGKNPLQLTSAIQMAALFQIVLLVVGYARASLGTGGILGSAVLLGTLDVDALTVSMADLTKAGTPASITAKAVMIGILSNTLVKLGFAVVLGRGRFRLLASAGLALMAASLGAALVWGNWQLATDN
jgi:uncharacterized membrane protein (DUF4010 family)